MPIDGVEQHGVWFVHGQIHGRDGIVRHAYIVSRHAEECGDRASGIIVGGDDEDFHGRRPGCNVYVVLRMAEVLSTPGQGFADVVLDSPCDQKGEHFSMDGKARSG